VAWPITELVVGHATELIRAPACHIQRCVDATWAGGTHSAGGSGQLARLLQGRG